MAPETEWKFVAVVPRDGDLKVQVAEMLRSSGFDGVAEKEIKTDTICARGHGEDSVRVWVRVGTKHRPSAPCRLSRLPRRRARRHSARPQYGVSGQLAIVERRNVMGRSKWRGERARAADLPFLHTAIISVEMAEGRYVIRLG
jgi:hypothetical protein